MGDWEEVMEKELHVVQEIIREAEEAATKRERERILALLKDNYLFSDMGVCGQIYRLIKGDKID
jgi:hypothetical protein